MKLFLHLLGKSSKELETYKNLSSLYYHYPFCKNICTYCNFNKYLNLESRYGSNFSSALSKSLLKETEAVLKLTNISSITSIYFGGGTPSLAPPSTFHNLIQFVKTNFEVNENAEITIECNPSSADMVGKLEEYAKSGVNRVSIGLQSVDESTLRLLGRDHNAQEGLTLLKQSQEIFGPNSVTVDFLFGKPGDTVDSLVTELNQILAYNLSHISVYELTPERGTKLFSQLKSTKIKLPDENEKTLMYQTIIDMLEKFSLHRYEVGSFGKEEVRSSHNSSYWNGSQYLGIGPGAHSRFFLKDQLAREARVQCLDPKLWQETVSRNGHATQVRRKQSSLEILTELLMTSLRTTQGLQQSRWKIFDSSTVRNVFENASSVEEFVRCDLLKWNSDDLRATKKGLNVVDAILPDMMNVLGDYYLNK